LKNFILIIVILVIIRDGTNGTIIENKVLLTRALVKDSKIETIDNFYINKVTF